MTKIRYIHGIQDVAYPVINSRKFYAAPLDWNNISDAQAQLMLLDENLQLKQHAFGSKKNIIIARNMIFEALGGTYNRSRYNTNKHIPAELQSLAYEIKNIVGSHRPVSRISGICKKPSCPQYDLNDTWCQGQWIEWSKCNNRAKILNGGFKKGAHHLLYAAIDNPNGVPQEVNRKMGNHKNVVFLMSKVTGFSEKTIHMVLENGTQTANHNKLGSPVNRMDTINGLKAKEGVGVIVWTAALLIKLATVLIAALTIVSQMMKSYQDAKLKSDLYKFCYSSPNCNPNDLDWGIRDDGKIKIDTETNTDNTGLYLIGGAAALLLLTNDKK